MVKPLDRKSGYKIIVFQRKSFKGLSRNPFIRTWSCRLQYFSILLHCHQLTFYMLYNKLIMSMWVKHEDSSLCIEEGAGWGKVEIGEGGEEGWGAVIGGGISF